MVADRGDATLALATVADVLRLAGLEPPQNERRAILCPLHAERTPSFQVQRSGRGFRCHGCGAHGGLLDLAIALGLASDRGGALEMLADRLGVAGERRRRRADIRPRSVLPPAKISRPVDVDRVRAAVAGCVPIAGTPAEVYLRSRGLPTSRANDVRFAPQFNGRPGVVFGVRDDAGKLVGAQARHLDERSPKATSCGTISAGIYATSSDALRASVLVVAEAPIDALSIAFATKLPAIALCGTALRDWLRLRALGRTFIIATDSDEAGERCAADLAAQLRQNGARVTRASFGDRKDANAMLLADGVDALERAVRLAI